MTPSPPLLSEVAPTVDAALADYLDEVETRLRASHPALLPLVEELRAFVLGGGKRLRPAFVVLGARAAGGTDDTAVLGPALALELVHTCALAHDDIIDAAATRRGRPTAHVAFARRHHEARWAGAGDRYGEAAAILLGDLAFVHADELFLRATVAPAHLLAAFRVFTTLREEVTAGQFLDVTAARSRATSADLALAVANLKSARYSVARPLEIGATLAAGPGPVADGLREVGIPLGQAFQLRDDILGVFGSEAETGKSIDSDLAEGKRTLLVALTAERLGDADRARLDGLLGKPDLTPGEADVIRDLMRSSGGLDATAAAADRLVDEAMGLLDALPVAPEIGATLRELSAFLVERSA